MSRYWLYIFYFFFPDIFKWIRRNASSQTVNSKIWPFSQWEINSRKGGGTVILTVFSVLLPVICKCAQHLVTSASSRVITLYISATPYLTRLDISVNCGQTQAIDAPSWNSNISYHSCSAVQAYRIAGPWAIILVLPAGSQYVSEAR
jgi:hypothetical protein